MPYNLIADANAYFAARYGFNKWGALSDAVKESALVSANQILDSLCVWTGYKTSENQEFAFPRNGESVVPDAVLFSECEIAYLIIDNESVSTDSGDSVSELKAGSVSLKFNAISKAGNPLVNGLVKTLLSPLGVCDFNLGTGASKTIPIYRG